MISQKTFKEDSFKHDYNQLSQGKYQLKLIYDKNSNSKWDTVIYLKHLQPEKVLYYNGEISIRQWWDIDVTWRWLCTSFKYSLLFGVARSPMPQLRAASVSMEGTRPTAAQPIRIQFVQLGLFNYLSPDRYRDLFLRILA